MDRAISRNVLIRVFEKYSFSETNELIVFMKSVCPPIPDRAASVFLKVKLEECLENHDNGSSYLDEIKCIVKKLEVHIKSFDYYQ